MASLEGFLPAGCAYTPAVPGLQSSEAELGSGCAEVVACFLGEREEVVVDHGAHRVNADVTGPRVTTTVPKEPRHGILPAVLQVLPEHVLGHRVSLAAWVEHGDLPRLRDTGHLETKGARVRPLEGVKVLDLSRVLAGPFAGRILSDLGAEVVKVEPPEGDVTRQWGQMRAGLAGYFTQQNVGKRNICVDLRVEGGPELITRLAAEADILIENFRPGIMKRYGIDYDALAAVNPRLVMLSISGFGQDGPESGRAAYAPILHAESGWLQRSGDWYERPVTDLNLSAADTNASLHGTIGIMAALRVAELTGAGQHIDMCMLDAFLATDDASHAGLDGIRYTAAGGLVWEGTDGPVLTAGDFRWIWKCLRDTHGLTDDASPDADVETKKTARAQAINSYLSSFATRTAMCEALDEANLAWADIKTTAEAYASPTAIYRGSSLDIDARDGGTRRVTQTPYRFSSSESGIDSDAVAPHRGEHNVDVLGDWLGSGPHEVAALFDVGVLLDGTPPPFAEG